MNNIQKAGITFGLVYAASYFMRGQTVKLKHFSSSEFGVWWPLMDSDLLHRLDDFRTELGAPVFISPALGSLGRPNGSPSSMHFPSPLVRAADIMSTAPLADMYNAAVKVGFSGIGLYPDWQPEHGMHVDVRPGREISKPATWSAYNDKNILTGEVTQKYTTIQKALA